jgi:hypothetical protein
MKKPYFITEDGVKIFYHEIAGRIAVCHPHLVGKHIFVQLEALGLLQQLHKGESPHSLPYSFSEYEL